MTRIQVTNELRGDLGELYFKHLCQQRAYAYIKLEDIYNTFSSKGVLEFKLGFDRIPIEIPEEITDEIWRVCKPTYIDGSPSFVFDFLTCSVYQGYYVDQVNKKNANEFNWVEIKTGESVLSAHQDQVRKQCKIPFSIFRIRTVDVSPHYVDIDWEYDSLRI
jgi:hypothetical protein